VWKGDEFRNYIVSFTYITLHGNLDRDDLFFHVIWKIKEIPSSLYFAWNMRLNKVSSKDNLGQRGVHLIENLCVLCGNAKESIEDLFFECKISNHAWNLCNKWT